MKQTKSPKDFMHGRVPPVSDHQADREQDFTAETFYYKTNPSWRIFRIMAEFVDGFSFISQFKKSVTFFGSARFTEKNRHYRDAQKLARLLARAGYTVISGGGPGIMEAANKGAVEGGGQSVGLNIQLPFEQRINPYVKRAMAFNYFYTRKVMLAFSASAFVFFPGGYGTLDEVFEITTLRQTHKINPRIPIILIGKDYWLPLAEWLHKVALERHGTIDEQEYRLWELVETPEEAMAIIKKVRLKRT